jgi:hypothetical protein
MIALLLAAALAAGPAPAAATTQTGAAPGIDSFTAEEVAYAHTALTVPGWSLLSAARDLVVFYKTDPSTTVTKLWIRGEHYPLGPDNPLGNGESFVTLYEVDCAGNRARTLSSTVYSGAKMQGDIVAASDKSGEWDVMKPHGFTALGAEEVCHKAVASTAQGSGSIKAASDTKPGSPTPRP